MEKFQLTLLIQEVYLRPSSNYFYYIQYIDIEIYNKLLILIHINIHINIHIHAHSYLNIYRISLSLTCYFIS